MSESPAILVATLRVPDGRTFDITLTATPNTEQHLGEHPYSGTIFHWTEGNYSCDCNRAILIERQHDIALTHDDADYHCGESITLVNLTIDGVSVAGECYEQ